MLPSDFDIWADGRLPLLSMSSMCQCVSPMEGCVPEMAMAGSRCPSPAPADTHWSLLHHGVNTLNVLTGLLGKYVDDPDNHTVFECDVGRCCVVPLKRQVSA